MCPMGLPCTGKSIFRVVAHPNSGSLFSYLAVGNDEKASSQKKSLHCLKAQDTADHNCLRSSTQGLMAVPENDLPGSMEREHGPLPGAANCLTAREKTQSLFPGWSLAGFAFQHHFLLCFAVID